LGRVSNLPSRITRDPTCRLSSEESGERVGYRYPQLVNSIFNQSQNLLVRLGGIIEMRQRVTKGTTH